VGIRLRLPNYVQTGARSGRIPTLIHDNKLDKGGHFAGWEQPALLAADVRAGFKSLGGSAFP